MSLSAKEYKQRISLGQSNNGLTWLLIINLTLFVSLLLIKTYYYFLFRDETPTIRFAEQALTWFVLPADLSKLITRPWTLLSHFFVQENILKMLANMLWLWTFGYILQDLTGNKKIIPVYIYGGFAAGLAFVLLYNFIPSLKSQSTIATLFGQSSGTIALAIATTMISPGYRIYPMLRGGFPLWILTVVYVIVLLATVSAYRIQHFVPLIAAAAMGWLFVVMVRRGSDWSDWMNNAYDRLNNLWNPANKKDNKKIKEELFYKAEKQPFKKNPHITQQRVDAILDKINQKGYNFLSDEEKDLLKKAAEEGL